MFYHGLGYEKRAKDGSSRPISFARKVMSNTCFCAITSLVSSPLRRGYQLQRGSSSKLQS